MGKTDSCHRRRRFTETERKAIFRLWQRGYTFAETARTYGTRRQTTRSIVLRFEPKLEDYRTHDHFRRLRLFRGQSTA